MSPPDTPESDAAITPDAAIDAACDRRRPRPTGLICATSRCLVRERRDGPVRVEVLRGVMDGLRMARHARFGVAAILGAPPRRDRLDRDHLDAVAEQLLGPFDAIVRRPEALEVMPADVGLAADRLGLPPQRCVVIGVTGHAVAAAFAAGAVGVLVPDDDTMPLEVRGVAHVYGDLADAVGDVVAWPEPGAAGVDGAGRGTAITAGGSR